MDSPSQHAVERPADDPDLSPAATEPPAAWLSPSPFAFIWHFVRNRYLGGYLTIAFLVVTAQAVETLEPYLLKRLINGLTTPDALLPPAGWFAVMMAAWLTGMLMNRGIAIVEIRFATVLREHVQNVLFGYLLGHAPRYFEENFAGKLGQKIKEAGNTTLRLLELLINDGLKILTMLIVGTYLLTLGNSMFALILVGWSVLYVLGTGTVAHRCSKLSRAFSDAASTSSGRMIDAITNVDTIRSFARVAFERRHLGHFLAEERRASRELRWFLAMMRLGQGVASVGLLGATGFLALWEIQHNRMTIGDFAMIFSLSSMVTMNVWMLSIRMLDFFEYRGAMTEALELVSKPHEIADRPGALPLRVTHGAIRFEQVSFGYFAEQPLFSNLDLSIEAGEKIALVGPSGAGKSTLVKLIRRHIEPTSGRILIDEQNIADVEWGSLNAAIAEVSQAPGVFHRPVRDNIGYGRLEADFSDIVAAAERAHCDDFIRSRPSGYDTIVGERGIKLSGGEKQRVAIARALLKDARILMLDEATSSLDSESEHLIQEALWEVMRDRTVIAIAHRLSTITRMDRILYLDHGRIIEQGSHEALLARKGAYARLWHRQVGGFLGAA